MNIEDLDLAARRCPVRAKGARSKAHRRGQARKDFVLETVYWDTGTARLLPRLLKGRTRGPVLVTPRRPGPGKVVSPRDVCPEAGLEVVRQPMQAMQRVRSSARKATKRRCGLVIFARWTREVSAAWSLPTASASPGRGVTPVSSIVWCRKAQMSPNFWAEVA